MHQSVQYQLFYVFYMIPEFILRCQSSNGCIVVMLVPPIICGSLHGENGWILIVPVWLFGLLIILLQDFPDDYSTRCHFSLASGEW